MELPGSSPGARKRPQAFYPLTFRQTALLGAILVVVLAIGGVALNSALDPRGATPFPATSGDTASSHAGTNPAAPSHPGESARSENPSAVVPPGTISSTASTSESRNPASPARPDDGVEEAGRSAATAVAGRADTGSGGGGAPSDGDDPPSLAISGAVMDDRGHLLPGIQVTGRLVATAGDAAVGEAMTRVTDAHGMFTFEDLVDGEYDLTADGGESYRPAKQRVRAGVASAELRLQRLRSVRVIGVVTGAMAAPLDAVRIQALGDDATAVTDSSGAYEVAVDLVKAGLPPALKFTRQSYREKVERVEAVLRSDAESVRLDVEMEPSETKVALSGRVLGPERETVSSVDVWLSSPDPRDFQRTRTDSGGEYRFPQVETGDVYRVGVEDAGGYRPFVSEPFAVGPHDTVHDIALEDSGEGWLTGEVVDPEGSPLPGFTLWLRSAMGEGDTLPIQTDGSGRFQVAGVPAGQLKLETRSQPYLHATGITLLANETRHVVVPLDWGPHWLFGQVVDGGGSPVAAARVVLQWNRQYPDVFSTSRREATSDRLGYFTFANLGAGEHVLTVTAPGFEAARLVKDPRQATGEFSVALHTSGQSGAGAGH